MRVLVLADALFAVRERTLLTRLEVGLADEGVRVIHAVPERVARGSGAGEFFAQALAFDDFGLSFGVRTRARAIARAVRRADPESRTDAVHVFGGSLWKLAAALAAELEAGAVFEVWRAGLAERAATVLRSANERVIFIAPDPTIERSLVSRVGSQHVRTVEWGVHASSDPKPPLMASNALTAVVVGTGRDAAAFESAFAALSEAVRQRPDLMIFADARAVGRSGVWKRLRMPGLLSNLSLIDEIESRRDLITQADFLIHPEGAGEQRSMVLDAMGAGMAVIAAEDAAVSYLIDGQTCALVRGRVRRSWIDTLLPFVVDPSRARALGETARRYIQTERPVSRHVTGVLNAYASIADREAIPFGRARATTPRP